MNPSRYVLAATVLAASQIVHAQTASPEPSAPVTSAPASALPKTDAEKASADKPSDNTKVSAETAKEQEPRIIRGNGQVIAAPKAFAAVGGAPVSFRFEEAPIAEVIRTVLGDILGLDYVMHPPLQGNVTLATRNPIAPDQAVFLLESALQANGLALVRDARGTFHAGRADALKNIAGSVRQMSGNASAAPIAPGYGAVIIPLQYIGAAEMAAILRPMVSADALVRVDTVRNLLVMMGTRTQAEGWMELVNTFDVDLLKGMSVGVFPLKYASVKEVEVALRLVSGGSAAVSSSAGSAGAALAGGSASLSSSATAPAATGAATLGEANPLFGALRIMPIDRINSILVVTPRPAYLEEARRWIERLDKPSDGGSEPQLFIYQVQNGNARHLASVLGSLFGGQTASTGTANSGIAPGLGASTSQTGTGLLSGLGTGASSNLGSNAGNTRLGGSTGFGATGGLGNNSRNTTQAATSQGAAVAVLGTIRVVADELNNSVLVWSTRGEFNKIESTLKRLDLPLTQVLIEASIIEVTLDETLQYGLQWTFSGDARSGYSGTGAIGGALSTAATNGFSYALSNSAGKLKATLSALASKSLIKMISNPSLMVLDNHTATITVGDQVPVSTSTSRPADNTNTSLVTSTIQYKDTGVSLSVTPSVNSGNVVAMQIDQTVTDVGAEEASANNQRRFMQRQIGSKVAVRSGESIVLGGLIKDNNNSSKSGVPLLKDIPLVGNLFSQNSSEGKRTELLVIITPRVVRSDIDIREVSDDLRERLKGLRIIEVTTPASRSPEGTTVQPSLAQ